MQIFLDEIAGRHLSDNVVMVLDGAGWHKSKGFRLPDNLRLLFLPPYSPELNPQKHLWDELREKHFHNRVFDSIDALEDHLVDALRDDVPTCLPTHPYRRLDELLPFNWIPADSALYTL